MQNALKMIAIVASLSLAACGASDEPPTVTETIAPKVAESVRAELDVVDWRRPCALTRTEDLAAVFPEVNFDMQDQFDDRLDSDGAASGVCVYNARAFRAEDAYEVIVTLAVWTEEETAYNAFATLTAEDAEGIERLEGFDEGAAYLVHNGEPVTAFMHEGTLIEIGVKHDARATFDGHDPSIALARRIANRL